MNMGIYSLKDLRVMEDDILTVKAHPKTDGERARVKIKGYSLEDMIFRRLGVKACLNLFCSWQPADDRLAISKDALSRVRLYFDAIDLYKFQSHSVLSLGNWGNGIKTTLNALTR